MAFALYSRLLDAFLIRGKSRALPAIPSTQLRAGLLIQKFSDRLGRLRVPHYWAQWVHDGRGPAPSSLSTGKILVWFRDPKNDPRYPGGLYPVKRSQVRKLTKAQFRKWSRINQSIISRYKRSTGKRILTAGDYRSMDLPMIIAQNSPGDRGQVKGVPFFSNAPGGGMYGFRKEANNIGSRITSRYVTETLQREGLLNMTINKTIRV